MIYLDSEMKRMPQRVKNVIKAALETQAPCYGDLNRPTVSPPFLHHFFGLPHFFPTFPLFPTSKTLSPPFPHSPPLFSDFPGHNQDILATAIWETTPPDFCHKTKNSISICNESSQKGTIQRGSNCGPIRSDEPPLYRRELS